MLRLVVTASPTGPIAESSTTYIAQSASAISVGPDTVPPGRSMRSLKGSRTRQVSPSARSILTGLPAPKTWGNSRRRNSSSSATLIFATAMRPLMRSLPSLQPVSYIKLTPAQAGRIAIPQTARANQPEPPILLRENVGSIAVLTLNRPAARNSLSEGLIGELHAALDEIRNDSSVRGVVIAANGPAFSAGHDMKELTARRSDADRGRAYFAQIMNACSAMMQAIVHLPKPVVASVQGIATAAGCQLAGLCDLAIASEAASFATPGVDIGLFCSTPMVALSRNVPRKQAMEMLLTG